MKRIKRIWHYLLYSITTKKVLLPGIAVIISIFAICWVSFSNGPNINWCDVESWWIKWADPITGLLTFFVAIIIWFMNSAKYWEDSLELKLTVIYNDINGRVVIEVQKAFLTHVGDIRAWGQQLGQQAISNTNYRFVMNTDIELSKPEVHKDIKSYYKHYTVIRTLTDLPKSDECNGYDITKGKFLWKEGEKTATFIPDEPIENNKTNIE